MLMKSVYVGAASLALGLMLFEGPRGGVLTSAPDKGKVQQKTATTTGTEEELGHTIRHHHVSRWIFIGGIAGGK